MRKIITILGTISSIALLIISVNKPRNEEPTQARASVDKFVYGENIAPSQNFKITKKELNPAETFINKELRKADSIKIANIAKDLSSSQKTSILNIFHNR